MTDLNHAHRTGTNRLPRLTTCATPYCTDAAATEAAHVYRDRTTDRTWLGTWRPTCDLCAHTDIHGVPADAGLHGSRVIGLAQRPLGA